MSHAQHVEVILLVDNDQIVRNLIGRMLAHQGYVVLEASRGEQALVTAAHHPGPLHLLVTDVMMPGMDGFRLADLLTVSRPEMGVLFISGHYGDSPAVRRGLHQSQRPFLLKPFRQDELATAIRMALDGPPDRDRDPFARILADPRIAAEPLQDSPPPHGIPRALRFGTRLTTRYRTRRGFDWHDGVTENISRSGVLFRNIHPLEPKTPVDIVLTLPAGATSDPTTRLCCQGEIVRVLPPEAPNMLVRVAES